MTHDFHLTLSESGHLALKQVDLKSQKGALDGREILARSDLPSQEDQASHEVWKEIKLSNHPGSVWISVKSCQEVLGDRVAKRVLNGDAEEVARKLASTLKKPAELESEGVPSEPCPVLERLGFQKVLMSDSHEELFTYPKLVETLKFAVSDEELLEIARAVKSGNSWPNEKFKEDIVTITRGLLIPAALKPGSSAAFRESVRQCYGDYEGFQTGSRLEQMEAAISHGNTLELLRLMDEEEADAGGESSQANSPLPINALRLAVGSGDPRTLNKIWYRCLPHLRFTPSFGDGASRFEMGNQALLQRGIWLSAAIIDGMDQIDKLDELTSIHFPPYRPNLSRGTTYANDPLPIHCLHHIAPKMLLGLRLSIGLADGQEILAQLDPSNIRPFFDTRVGWLRRELLSIASGSAAGFPVLEKLASEGEVSMIADCIKGHSLKVRTRILEAWRKSESMETLKKGIAATFDSPATGEWFVQTILGGAEEEITEFLMSISHGTALSFKADPAVALKVAASVDKPKLMMALFSSQNDPEKIQAQGLYKLSPALFDDALEDCVDGVFWSTDEDSEDEFGWGTFEDSDDEVFWVTDRDVQVKLARFLSSLGEEGLVFNMLNSILDTPRPKKGFFNKLVDLIAIAPGYQVPLTAHYLRFLLGEKKFEDARALLNEVKKNQAHLIYPIFANPCHHGCNLLVHMLSQKTEDSLVGELLDFLSPEEKTSLIVEGDSLHQILDINSGWLPEDEYGGPLSPNQWLAESKESNVKAQVERLFAMLDSDKEKKRLLLAKDSEGRSPLMLLGQGIQTKWIDSDSLTLILKLASQYLSAAEIQEISTAQDRAGNRLVHDLIYPVLRQADPSLYRTEASLAKAFSDLKLGLSDSDLLLYVEEAVANSKTIEQVKKSRTIERINRELLSQLPVSKEAIDYRVSLSEYLTTTNAQPIQQPPIGFFSSPYGQALSATADRELRKIYGEKLGRLSPSKRMYLYAISRSIRNFSQASTSDKVLKSKVLPALRYLRDTELPLQLSRLLLTTKLFKSSELNGEFFSAQKFTADKKLSKNPTTYLSSLVLESLCLNGFSKEVASEFFALISSRSVAKDALKGGQILKFLCALSENTVLSMPGKQALVEKAILGLSKADYKPLLENLSAAKNILMLGSELDFLRSKEKITAYLARKAQSLMGITGEEEAVIRTTELFLGSRNPQAILTYAATMKDESIHSEPSRLLGEFLQSIVDEKWPESRYKLDSPHMQGVFGDEDGKNLLDRWKQEFSVSVEDLKKTSESHTEDLPFDLKAWLKEKILTHNHLSGVSLPFLCTKLQENEGVNKGAPRELESKLMALLDEKSGTSSGEQMKKLEKWVRESSDYQLRPEAFSEFLNDIKGQLSTSQSRVPKEHIVTLTDDPIDLLLLGTESQGSCQRVDGSPRLNQGLLGYIHHGWIRALVIKDPDGGALQGRSLLKILQDSSGKPAILMETVYGGDEVSEILRTAARKIGLRLGLAVYQVDRKEPKVECLKSLGGKAPEYSDSADGYSGIRLPGDTYTISRVRRL